MQKTVNSGFCVYCKCGKTGGKNQMKLRIKETAWAINRMAGGYREELPLMYAFPVKPGSFPILEKASGILPLMRLRKQYQFSVHCADPKYNKSWKINKGEEITYKPRSFDGGYFYDIKLN